MLKEAGWNPEKKAMDNTEATLIIPVALVILRSSLDSQSADVLTRETHCQSLHVGMLK